MKKRSPKASPHNRLGHFCAVVTDFCDGSYGAQTLLRATTPAVQNTNDVQK